MFEMMWNEGYLEHIGRQRIPGVFCKRSWWLASPFFLFMLDMVAVMMKVVYSSGLFCVCITLQDTGIIASSGLNDPVKETTSNRVNGTNRKFLTHELKQCLLIFSSIMYYIFQLKQNIYLKTDCKFSEVERDQNAVSEVLKLKSLFYYENLERFDNHENI
jgi:hypothetical protein